MGNSNIIGSSSGARLNSPRPSMAVNVALNTSCGNFSLSIANFKTFNRRITHSFHGFASNRFRGFAARMCSC